MVQSCTMILDIGKTHAKLSLWDAEGSLIAKRVRANVPQQSVGYRALDVQGIERVVVRGLREFAALHHIVRMGPVGHRAAAAVIREGRLFCAPMDYEDLPAPRDSEEYAAQRDMFRETGSPLLPCSLNLGMQLNRLEGIHGAFLDDVTIVPWPQYWAWRLCGVAATEATSLGCHTDLWRPLTESFGAAGRRAWRHAAGERRGFALNEWQGARARRRTLVWLGIAALVGSTIVIGIGNMQATQ